MSIYPLWLSESTQVVLVDLGGKSATVSVPLSWIPLMYYDTATSLMMDVLLSTEHDITPGCTMDEAVAAIKEAYL